jgi:protein gp37
MGAQTGIEWTDATWNPVTGCTNISLGCKNCYAERDFARMAANPKLPSYLGRKFTDVRCHPERLDAPLHWEKPRRVFVNSMSDLFHEDVPDEFIQGVFRTMAHATQHTFQILTKRPERMRRYVLSTRNPAVIRLPNVWLGVSVENQPTADERIPILLNTPAAMRFLSVEPMLERIDLQLEPRGGDAIGHHSIDWVIVGGESGPNARPCNLNWLLDIVRQCKAAGVPCFVKQLGSRAIAPETPGFGAMCSDGFLRLRHNKGGYPAEWHESLRVREYPR